MSDFPSLGLNARLLGVLESDGFTKPTPIQVAAIPPGLAGRDVLGLAQTGTGKTIAFALPLLQRLAAEPKRVAPKAPRVLVLTPTRELAIQVGETFGRFGAVLGLTHTVVHGGVSLGPQVRAMNAGPDILVATPGRLLDLMGQGEVKLNAVEAFVLDEADRMLDMGFIHDVKRVVAVLPAKRHTLFFSATMPDAVTKLAHSLLRDHVRVEVAPPSSTVDRIAQSVVMVDNAVKNGVLGALLSDPAVTRAIIFTRTKRGANKLAAFLTAAGIQADPFHANKSQPARERALAAFKSGASRALVATDIAARGIDVDGISHVFNFDLPEVPEAYVHRIGRTGRAGKDGVAVSLVTGEDRPLLRDIEKAIRRSIAVAPAPAPIATPSAAAIAAATPANRPAQPQGSRGGRGGNGQQQGRQSPGRPQQAGNRNGGAGEGNRQQRPGGPKPANASQPGSSRAEGGRPAQGARPDANRQDRPRRPDQPRAEGGNRPQAHHRPDHARPAEGGRNDNQRGRPAQGAKPAPRPAANTVSPEGDWAPAFLKGARRGS